ncbi:MAG: hypothetical protein AVDCRST_MAG77-4097 [uncultured Chloroflexi bacterium]|uniref:Phosphohistidine phosphatase SixA n=1 Tax=uncultured Chloroflexota bacterium TaxID=166587 RepID=A0A6J4JPZ2_9CHLR|nr:MAG: hypothetical protein AVDCRST_MAG77-4097 [uncultured Chloroflexota bacterium]
MLLFLVRHAIAEERSPERWPDDRARPLTDEGRRRFRSAARGLRAIAATPDHVLSSPFTRAIQTAALLQEHARWPEAEHAEALRADQAVSAFLPLLERHLQLPALGLVGHEPFLGDLASLLLTGDTARTTIEFKKGAVACLRIHATLAGRADLVWLLPPRVLRMLGS